MRSPILQTVVNLLVVLDERESVACRFGPETTGVGIPGGYPVFGLTHVVAQLKGTRGLTIKTAHRSTDPDAEMQNFTFSAASLANIDVVWMIGSGGSSSPGSISASEVAALSTFMQQGGGIFATGDHADYGSAMAAGIPRVGDMRLWDGPTATGPDRVTTIQPSDAFLSEALSTLAPPLETPPTHDYANNALPHPLPSGTFLVAFENQSAGLPAPIAPKLFREGPFPNPFGLPQPIRLGRGLPLYETHPLVEMDDGSVLKGLPGHMHEGVVPPPGTASSYVGNANYPAKDGVQPTPDLVAMGQCLNQYNWPQYNDEAFVADYTNPTTYFGPYGVIGAYDGWSVGVGRIAVDSTFHHFFDINLIGDKDCIERDPRGGGYTDTDAGQAALTQINNYHRNLVFWLGHAHKVLVKLVKLMHETIEEQDMRELLQAGFHEQEDQYKSLGAKVTAAIGKRGMPPAHAFDALLILTEHRVLPPWFWGNTGGRPVLSAREAEHIFSSALGAALATLYEARTMHDTGVDGEKLVAILRKGLWRGVGHALSNWPPTFRKPSPALRLALTPQQEK